MALGTEEATFNAAVNTLMDAWETMVDALALDERTTKVVFIKPRGGDNPNDSTRHDADATDRTGAEGADTIWDFSRKFEIKNNPDVLGDIPISVGGRPLFFKVTNDAGDVT